MAELKLLDPNRKAFLHLPNSALRVWVAFWVYESDDQEAYPSLKRLAEATGLSRTTIIRWRDYLLKTGWLLRLTGYAASRYSKPTRGSHTVAVYRVNDPTKDKGFNNCTLIKVKKGAIIEPLADDEVKGCKIFTPQKLDTRFIPVSMSLPLSEAVSEAVTSPTSASADGSDPSLRDSLTTTSKAKTKTKTPASGIPATPVEAKAKHSPKYDAPFPYDFNTWSQVDRTRWSMEHSVSRSTDPVPSIPSERRASPPNSAPPPTGGTHTCPACDYTARHRYNLADHVEAQHPELPSLWLGPIQCPHCQWKKFYLDNNSKERYEVVLAEHIIEQHADKI